jgi:hypothetical protein
MNTLVKIATISGILWVVCIIGTIVWSNATIEGDDDFDPKHLPSASWGVPVLGALAFILFMVFIITLIIGLKRKK